MLGSSVAARNRLETSLPVLPGARPIELVDASEEGLQQILTILIRVDYGRFS